MRSKTERAKTISVRVSPDLKHVLNYIAAANVRTMSEVVHYAIEKYVEREFPEIYAEALDREFNWR